LTEKIDKKKKNAYSLAHYGFCVVEEYGYAT
jgi:hypothetical protein